MATRGHHLLATEKLHEKHTFIYTTVKKKLYCNRLCFSVFRVIKYARTQLTLNNDAPPVTSVASIGSPPLFAGLAVKAAGTSTSRPSDELHAPMVDKVTSLWSTRVYFKNVYLSRIFTTINKLVQTCVIYRRRTDVTRCLSSIHKSNIKCWL